MNETQVSFCPGIARSADTGKSQPRLDLQCGATRPDQLPGEEGAHVESRPSYKSVTEGRRFSHLSLGARVCLQVFPRFAISTVRVEGKDGISARLAYKRFKRFAGCANGIHDIAG